MANEARMKEGDSRDENKWDEAYDLWTDVYLKCVEFERDFYHNDNVEWAKKKQLKLEKKLRWKLMAEGFLVGILASLAATFLYKFISSLP